MYVCFYLFIYMQIYICICMFVTDRPITHTSIQYNKYIYIYIHICVYLRKWYEFESWQTFGDLFFWFQWSFRLRRRDLTQEFVQINLNRKEPWYKKACHFWHFKSTAWNINATSICSLHWGQVWRNLGTCSFLTTLWMTSGILLTLPVWSSMPLWLTASSGVHANVSNRSFDK